MESPVCLFTITQLTNLMPACFVPRNGKHHSELTTHNLPLITKIILSLLLKLKYQIYE